MRVRARVACARVREACAFAAMRRQSSDVMVTPHGADMINAFALHRGATVLEVMPVYQAEMQPRCSQDIAEI